jgi:Ca2+/Na+ antiporter
MNSILSFFEVVLVLATVVYVYFTFKLFVESRKSRESNLRPHIILYLESAETDPTSRFLIIQNAGPGVAKNLKFKIEKDFKPTTSYDRSPKERKFLTRNFQNFPPNYTMKSFILDTQNDFASKMKEYVIISCTYKDVLDNFYKDSFELHVKDSYGSTKMTPPDTYLGAISYQLEKIQKELKMISAFRKKE